MTEQDELIKAKDDEIEKLTKVKDALKQKFMEFKKENGELKEELKKLKEKPQVPAQDSELTKKLEEAQSKIKELEEQLNKAKEGKSKTSDDGEESVSNLMNQIKNGMFKLGQQNHTITQRVEEILKKMEGGTIVKEISPSAAEKPRDVERQPLSPSQRAKLEAGDDKPKKEEYISPGLMASNKDSEEKEEKKEEKEDFKARRPSDILKSRDDGEKPKEIVEEKKDTSESEGEAKKPEPKAPPIRGIKTVDYPDDGIIKCPYCEKQNYVEQTNKAKIISFAPVKKYGKKYYCKECRGEWDFAM